MTATRHTHDRRRPNFAHTALIIDSDETLRARLIPALRYSLEAGEPVLMVVGERARHVICEVVGNLGDELRWAEPGAFHQRLGFAYEGFRRYLAQRHAAGRRIHVITEPDVTTDLGPTAPFDRATAYLSYESVCNETYAPYGCPVTCIWDSRRHPAAVIEGVRSLHNHVLTEAGRIPNSDYVPPQAYLSDRSRIPLESPPPMIDFELRITDLDQLGSLRGTVRGWAGEHAFSAEATDDIVVAVTEVATNGVIHGGPPVKVRAWCHGETLVVQVDDTGGRPLPVTAGYQPPRSEQTAGGRGLWLARQLADTVAVHTGTGCTSVRLHFPRVITHRNLSR